MAKPAKNIFGDFSGDKIMERMFRKVDNVVWDITTGSLSVATDDGLLSYKVPDEENPSGTTSINFLSEFSGIPVPAFARNVSIDDVKTGDLLYTNGEPFGWVVSNKGNGSFRVHTVTGLVTDWSSPKGVGFGFGSGVFVVQSLMAAAGGEDNFGGMSQGLIQMMMMSGMAGNDSKLDRIIPFMLMSGGKVDPMMMMLMMGGAGNF